jgi:hypothetical protein
MVRIIMLSAIDFNSKPNCRTVKIHNVCAQWVLTAETQAVELGSLQDVPELLFRTRGTAAQPARLSRHLLGS